MDHHPGPEHKTPSIPSQKSVFWDPNLQIIFAVTLSAVMGVSSITPAFPKISKALMIDSHQIGWLITIFTIPGILLTPILGMVADRLGRKKILAPSLFIYSIFGTLCAFTHDFEVLLLLRFLQGIGGASLGALNVTLIGDLYEGQRRTEAMGYNASILSVGTAIYPAIGGSLAIIGWNFPFLLSALVFPIGFLVIFKLKNPRLEKKQRLFDYLKSIGQYVKSWHVWGLFGANFLTFIMLYGGVLTFLPVLLDERFAVTSLVIGLILSASSIVTGITSSQLGKISKVFHEATLVKIAAACYAAVFLSIPFITNIWQFFIPITLFGFAQGVNIPSTLTLLTRSAPMEYRAAFMSLNWMVLRCGQAAGPIVLGIIFKFYGMDAPFFASLGVAAVMLGLVSFSVVRK